MFCWNKVDIIKTIFFVDSFTKHFTFRFAAVFYIFFQLKELYVLSKHIKNV